ncbi:MAG: NERD domain-containing protein [Methanobrevibacter sp.]|uniref:NERD domain-containing protein n=1 Tax=Methanobrevibacter sp. TaxID=66852 RepID=UPI001B5DA47E|nr:NERD domain-containing protein [Methanobrevibacter sp.]MBP3791886.1 NERD domain-containing protein [Methanobrevibacter sp.]
MKVVCCKNCGAKYQLDDDDDISTFECSSCAGDLEYLEDYSDGENTSNSSLIDSFKYDNSYIVQCEDCGLKYKIKSSDSILDYECDSCGGSLRYLDEEMNKELDKYLEERKKEIETIREQNKVNKPTSEELTNEEPDRSLKSFTDKIGDFFSEEHMLKIADDEKKEMELQEEEVNLKTARTTIPDAVLSKFGREFAIPKTNDYTILKNFLKDEFFKSMGEYYPKTEQKSSSSFLEKISIKEPESVDEIVPNETSLNDSDEGDFDIHNLNSNELIILIGAAIFILSIIEILIINSGIGIIALFIGVIMLCYGLYKTRDVKQIEERTRIIREHLLTLSNEYYVFYNVKTPTSNSGINHVVVGPTGIYALLSQKYNPKLRLEAENENLNLIGSAELDEDKIEEVPTMNNTRRFRYTTKQAKFSQDDKVKQKALSLGEDLINFLNDNNIRNCFVEPLVGFINNEVVVINMPLTDEDLFIEELLYQIKTSTIKLDQETIDKCAVLLSHYSADCSAEI